MRADGPDEASDFNVLKPRSKGPALLPPGRGQSRWSEPGNEIPAIRARALESIRREGRERGIGGTGLDARSAAKRSRSYRRIEDGTV